MTSRKPKPPYDFIKAEGRSIEVKPTPQIGRSVHYISPRPTHQAELNQLGPSAADVLAYARAAAFITRSEFQVVQLEVEACDDDGEDVAQQLDWKWLLAQGVEERGVFLSTNFEDA